MARTLRFKSVAALLRWRRLHPRQLIRTLSITAEPSSAVQLPKLVQSSTPNQSLRGSKIDLVVMHDTEGPYAGSVSWLKNPASQASAHVVLREDGKEATQLVPFSKKAWACVSFNSRSLNLEMAGKASVGYSAAEIDAAARIVAYWCRRYQLPVQNALGGTRPGITFHQDLGAAGGGHHDPGWTSAQKSSFIAKVKTHSGHGFTPSPWGRE